MRDGADAAADGARHDGQRSCAPQLRSGKDLKTIAAEKGVPYATVIAAALAPVKARLDAAVAAGTLTRARADKVLARLEANLADGRLRNERPARPATPRRLTRQSKTMTWRSPSPERSRSKAGSRSSRPIRRSMSRSTGRRPSR